MDRPNVCALNGRYFSLLSVEGPKSVGTGRQKSLANAQHGPKEYIGLKADGTIYRCPFKAVRAIGPKPEHRKMLQTHKEVSLSEQGKCKTKFLRWDPLTFRLGTSLAPPVGRFQSWSLFCMLRRGEGTHTSIL